MRLGRFVQIRKKAALYYTSRYLSSYLGFRCWVPALCEGEVESEWVSLCVKGRGREERGTGVVGYGGWVG